MQISVASPEWSTCHPGLSYNLFRLANTSLSTFSWYINNTFPWYVEQTVDENEISHDKAKCIYDTQKINDKSKCIQDRWVTATGIHESDKCRCIQDIQVHDICINQEIMFWINLTKFIIVIWLCFKGTFGTDIERERERDNGILHQGLINAWKEKLTANRCWRRRIERNIWFKTMHEGIQDEGARQKKIEDAKTSTYILWQQAE